MGHFCLTCTIVAFVIVVFVVMLLLTAKNSHYEYIKSRKVPSVYKIRRDVNKCRWCRNKDNFTSKKIDNKVYTYCNSCGGPHVV